MRKQKPNPRGLWLKTKVRMRRVVTHLAVEAVIGAIGAEGSVKTWRAGTGKLKHMVKNKTINHAKQKQLKK